MKKEKEQFQEVPCLMVGAGAAGLFCAAQLRMPGGVIAEAAKAPGIKLLASGGGQCNFTRSDNIKDFLAHYGEHGKRIRSCLFKYNNLRMREFFAENGVPSFAREDGKVFPKSLSAKDVRDMLVKKSVENGWQLLTQTEITSLQRVGQVWEAQAGSVTFRTPKVVVATGGRSWGVLGNGGGMQEVLAALDVDVTAAKPALVPITVEKYPFAELAGISFKEVEVEIRERASLHAKRVASLKGDVLLTHRDFSGPAVLDISRYAYPGCGLVIRFADIAVPKYQGSKKNLLHLFQESCDLPERFLRCLMEEAGANPKEKAASVSGSKVKAVTEAINGSVFSVSGTEGFKRAMVTAGGVALNAVSTKTFEVRDGLYVVGEALDVDGDEGGYNLQFAFSSACAAAASIENQ